MEAVFLSLFILPSSLALQAVTSSHSQDQSLGSPPRVAVSLSSKNFHPIALLIMSSLDSNLYVLGWLYTIAEEQLLFQQRTLLLTLHTYRPFAHPPH